MPELPEVETIRRGLAARLAGRELIHVEARRPDLRIPLPEDLATRLVGRRFDRFERRGKYLLLRLDDGTVLVVHLGMSGRLIIDDKPPTALGPHDHVVLTCGGGPTVVYTDPRRFGLMALSSDNEIADHPLLKAMGPDPLTNGFDGRALAERLAGKHTSIKAALLDQKVVAGLGNIYACEALFYAGLSPRRSAHTVQRARADRLAKAIQDVLDAAIEAGGSTLRDYAQASGELGYFQHRFAVYDREGAACPGCDCGGVIKRIVQSNRSTFYCPRRQR
jgi:formamidopyrimidine-DNA glycosylase